MHVPSKNKMLVISTEFLVVQDVFFSYIVMIFFLSQIWCFLSWEENTTPVLNWNFARGIFAHQLSLNLVSIIIWEHWKTNDWFPHNFFKKFQPIHQSPHCLRGFFISMETSIGRGKHTEVLSPKRLIYQRISHGERGRDFRRGSSVFRWFTLWEAF